jgi:PAS domain-containing protein
LGQRCATFTSSAAQPGHAPLRLFIDDSPVLQLGLNVQGSIEQVSRFVARSLGFEADDLIGQPFALLHPKTDTQR